MITRHPTLRATLVAAAAAAACVALFAVPGPATPPGAIDSHTALAAGIAAVFRLAAIVLTAYVALVSAVAAGAGLTGWSNRLQRMRVAPAALQRLVFGSSLAFVATAAPLTAATAEPAPQRDPPTMVAVEERPPSTGLDPDAALSAAPVPRSRPALVAITDPTDADQSAADAAAARSATTHAPNRDALDNEDPPARRAVSEAPAGQRPDFTGPHFSAHGRSSDTVDAGSPGPVPIATPAGTTTWTVRPGEHFWSIAAAVVEGELDRPGTEAEIGERWVALIELNAAELVDPDNPDLLLPGQVLRL